MVLGIRRFLWFTAVLVLVGAALAQEAAQQESGGITPFTPPVCSQSVQWWASQPVLWEGSESLPLADTPYTGRQLKQFLMLGGSAGRDNLPLVIRLAQELVAYRLNLKVGFPATSESESVAAEFEALLGQLAGGLPRVDATGFDEAEIAEQLPYYYAVLSGYNQCMEPGI